MILKTYSTYTLILFINFYISLQLVSSLNEEAGISENQNIQQKSLNSEQNNVANNTDFELSIDLSVKGISNIIVNVTCNNKKKINKKDIVLPSGYKWVDGLKDAYKWHSEKMMWNQAHRVCTNERAHLAYIESKEEEQYLISLLRTGEGYMWIGIHDMFMEGYWLTVLGQPVNRIGYQHWSEKNPDNWNGNENCGSVRRSGWNDIKCDSSFSFVCKIFASTLEESFA